jgi:hypothetical protein
MGDICKEGRQVFQAKQIGNSGKFVGQTSTKKYLIFLVNVR